MKSTILICTILFASACGDNLSNGAQTADVDDVSIGSTDASGTQESGSGQGASPAKTGAELVRLPYGIAHYPDGKYLSSSIDVTSKGGKDPTWYQYDTMDEPAAVLEFYRGEAEKAGFIVNSESAEPAWREIVLKSARPGGGLMNVNTIGDKGGMLLINLHISKDN